MTEKNLTYIDTPAALAAVLPHLDAAPADDGIAVDTESDSLYSYQERVCLLQLSTRERDLIIDPLRLTDLSSLWPILQRKCLLFHGADYDISCLRRDYGLAPTAIFDTMLASWVLGYGQVSLAHLTEAELGVVLTKSHQQADWGQRPLSASMIDYARNDTAYLHQLRDILRKELQSQDLEDAAQEEFTVVMHREPRVLVFDPEGYSQIKGARDLPVKAAPALRALYIWRDGVAKERNVPAFRVLRNDVLLRLAEHRPQDFTELRRIVPMPAAQQYQTVLMSLLQNPPPLPPTPPRERRQPPGALLSDEGKAQLQRLKAWRDETAKQVSTEPSVVATTAFLESVVVHQPKTLDDLSRLPNVRAWRVKRFGQSLLDCFLAPLPPPTPLP